jgi:hypothetical protein
LLTFMDRHDSRQHAPKTDTSVDFALSSAPGAKLGFA